MCKEIKSYLDILDKQNITYYSVDIECIKKDGDWERKNNYPDQLKKNITNMPMFSNKKIYTKYINKKKCTVIFLGEVYNLIGIDIDPKGDTLKMYDKLCKNNGYDRQTLSIETMHKGYHEYYRLTDIQRQGLKNFKSFTGLDSTLHIDVKYNNQFFVGPSIINADKKYTYKIYKDVQPIILPDFLYDIILKRSKNGPITKNNNKQSTNKNKNIDTNIFIDNVNNTHNKIIDNYKLDTPNVKLLKEKNDIDDNDIKIILKEGIANLDKNINYNYQKWSNLGIFCYQYGDYGIELWKQFSKNYEKYDEIEINKKIKTFHYDHEEGTLRVLLSWLKEDNLEFYEKYYAKYKEKIKMMSKTKEDYDMEYLEKYYKLSHDGFVKLYHEVRCNDIVCTNIDTKICYMWNDNKKIWEITHYSFVCNDFMESMRNIMKPLIVYYQKMLHIFEDNPEICKKYNKLINTIEKTPEFYKTNACYAMLQKILSKFYDTNKMFEDKIDSCRHVLNFKNGLLDLRNGKFRNRTREDFVATFLNYDYADSSVELKKEIYDIIFNISNSDEELCKFNLSWLSYCMTGETNLQLFLMSVGYTASNGKSTLAEIFMNSLPVYSSKLSKKTFTEGYPKVHKQMIKAVKPKRFIFIEELDRDKIDATELKDFVSGNKINVEIMYGTCNEFPIHGKLVVTSNKDPNFDNDAGIMRRGLMQLLTNRYFSLL
jgi:hypothetical protein